MGTGLSELYIKTIVIWLPSTELSITLYGFLEEVWN